NPQTRGDVLSALNSFLKAMSQRDDPPAASPKSNSSEDETTDVSRGGLQMRDWSASSNHDNPVRSYEAVYREWLNDIDWLLDRFERDPVATISEIGQVLKAINRSNVLILILEDLNRSQGESVENLAVQSPRNVIKDLYTQRSIKGRLDSRIASLFELVQLQMEQEPKQATELYDAIADNIYPNTVLASLIASEHIADSPAEYYQQQDWGFEELLIQHFLDEDALIAELSPSRVETTAAAMTELLEGVAEIIDQSRCLRRYASHAYLDKTAAQQAVRSRLASSLLYAGPEAIEKYQEEYGQIKRIEAELKMNEEWLPSEQRSCLDGWI
ncbi:hypothetical protein, partial [Natronococcus sp. A-GB7]|uniref:hypothetical protein n=1 Tax=Natronococcus sp. A-GB7 TaxID=3037649 RepID=UPI00241D429A